MKKFSFQLLTALVMLTLFDVVGQAAASRPTAPSADDQKAKQFAPALGKAAIYIYMIPGMRGIAAALEVTVDGRSLGPIDTQTFQMLEVDPGEHDVWIIYPYRKRFTILVTVQATAGETYFVRASKVSHDQWLVDPTLGKNELAACCALSAAPPVAVETLFP